MDDEIQSIYWFEYFLNQSMMLSDEPLSHLIDIRKIKSTRLDKIEYF